MKYLHYFETEAAFNQARSNNYEEPWTSYTNGKGLDFNKDFNKEYFTLNILTSGTIGLNGIYDENLYYSKNGDEWTFVDSNENNNYTVEYSVVSGDHIRFKGQNHDNGLPYFSIGGTAQFNASGNVMSLLEGDNFENVDEIVAGYALMSLFKYCTTIISAKNLKLPATKVGYAAYGLNDSDAWGGMFYDCTNLVEGPTELPAVEAGASAYCHMFDGCSSMVTGPTVIKARQIGDYCCMYMFSGCSSMTTVPDILPATTLTTYCYGNMFSSCSSLIRIPTLPATDIYEYAYYQMFSGCTSLTTVSNLPMTTVGRCSCRGMFSGCTSLTKAPDILPAMTLATECYWDMFNGCTSLTTAPVLPALTLVQRCYSSMFQGCSNLNYVKAMFTSDPASNDYQRGTSYWLSGVAATGTFVKNVASQWNVTGANGIPSGWTVQTASS